MHGSACLQFQLPVRLRKEDHMFKCNLGTLLRLSENKNKN